MSSRSETDDEFESADEGSDYSTEESSSENDSVSKDLSEITNSKLEESDIIDNGTLDSVPIKATVSITSSDGEPKSSASLCDELDTAVASSLHKLNVSEGLEETQINEELDCSAERFNNKQIPEACLEPNVSPSEPGVPKISHEEVIVSSNATKLEEEIASEVSIPEVEIPSEIANKISTRNISNSGRIRSKPTLGAKKLGAVKVTQAPEFLKFPSAKPVPQISSSEEPPQSSLSRNSLNETTQKDGGGWGWFAPPKSLISSVSSITNQILSTVENGLNIPDPEDLAKEEMLIDEKSTETKKESPVEPPKEEKSAGFTQLFGGVSNITRFVESTGSSLFSTGLDTLELLGKKTIDVLQQTDPGLKRTKAVLVNPLESSQERPSLSKMLREAKEVAETSEHEKAQATTSNKKEDANLTNLFEHHNGLVHLEALEILSQQCQNRITPQLRRLPSQRKVLIDEIAAICSRTEDSDDHDMSDSDIIDLQSLEQHLSSSFDALGLEVSLKKLMNGFREGIADPEDKSSSSELYRHALNSLALVTSLAVELYHKGAELVLMTSKPANPAAGARLEAETFQNVTSFLTAEISRLGNHHASQIIRTKTSDTIDYSTDIYYEASNCRSYLENALKLMIPVLQSRLF